MNHFGVDFSETVAAFQFEVEHLPIEIVQIEILLLTTRQRENFLVEHRITIRFRIVTQNDNDITVAKSTIPGRLDGNWNSSFRH